jgi:sodium transport system permease protein
VKAAAFVVYRKELKDAIRDRRTAIMIFVASILMGPVTLVLLAQYVSGLEEKAKVLKVRLAGREHAPALVNFLQRNDVEIEEAPANYETGIARAGWTR